MLRVLVKVRTFVNGATREIGEEITIMSHLFSKEVHTILEDFGLAEGELEPAEPLPEVEEPAPPATKVSPASPPSPATAKPAAPAVAASDDGDHT